MKEAMKDLKKKVKMLGLTYDQWAILCAWRKIEYKTIRDYLDTKAEWMKSFPEFPDDNTPIIGVEQEKDYNAVYELEMMIHKAELRLS